MTVLNRNLIFEMGRQKRKQRQTKAARGSLSLQQIDNTTFNETDEVETLNAEEEEASINNNDTVAASINNEEDDNNMDIADSDDQHIHRTHSSSNSEFTKNTAKLHIFPNSIEAATTVPSIDIAKPTPSSSQGMNRNQRKKRNLKIRKAEERVENERYDGALQHLAWQNTLHNFLTVKQIPSEIIDAADMLISMLLYLKFGILLYPNSSIFQPSFLDCLAIHMNTSLNNIQLTIIEFINKNVNSEVFSDTTEAFLNAYKDEINSNNITKTTYYFLYNHMTLIFKVYIIFFSYIDSKVVLNYCPKNINLQSHDFNEENTIAIIEDKGKFKKLCRMEPRYLISSVSSANSNTE